MKTNFLILNILLILLLIGCEKDKSEKTKDVNISSVSFSECNTELKSAVVDTPSVVLTGQSDGNLKIEMINTEFCCGTDSISFSTNIESDKISIEVIDNGPYTYCFCTHDLEFYLNDLESKDYELTLIESSSSGTRDTFKIQFRYSESLDTTVTETTVGALISDYPVNYLNTEFGGCNETATESLSLNYEDEVDTLIINEQSDSLNIFVGLNMTCCLTFEAESEIVGDTLVLHLNTLTDDACDCICYYTFNYIFEDYNGQGFYYKFYVDKSKIFEGDYNLP